MEPLFRIKDNSSSTIVGGGASGSNNSTGMLLSSSSSSSVAQNSPTGLTTATGTTATTFTTVPDALNIYLPSHNEAVTAGATITGGGSSITANNIELNTAASLSDDSGVPLTTNSSISSGDSYRFEICRFESSEMVESDGEVSQFDSLDNCSEGGMSAENFNTLKKGPLAPIDPPPEFQDSPKTTLARSISKNIVNNLRRWTSSQSSFKHTSGSATVQAATTTTTTVAIVTTGLTPAATPHNGCNIDDRELIMAMGERNGVGISLKDSYAINRHLYLSDSIINTHSDSDNIYDEPHNATRNSLGHIIEPDGSSSLLPSPVPSPPPPVSMVKIKQTLCPYHEDHSRYFKAIISAQDGVASPAAQKFNSSGLSDIHDYDLYYGAKRNVAYHHHHHHHYAQCEQIAQRKILQSPLNSSNNCHNHHYYTGVNRPNSRNSLNSRLSSSHNSLSVSTANKPDDSIFITQAMSHDALLTRNEISDFYNVPIDSDIYALPIDMIPLSKSISKTFSVGTTKCKDGSHQQHQHAMSLDGHVESDTQFVHSAHSLLKMGGGGQQQHLFLRSAELLANNNASSTESECTANTNNTGGSSNKKFRRNGNCKTARSKHKSTPGEDGLQCPAALHLGASANNRTMHMTLDEVKQFYNTLYAEGGSAQQQQHQHCQRSVCSSAGGYACKTPHSGLSAGTTGSNSCSVVGSITTSSSATTVAHNNNNKTSNSESVCWRQLGGGAPHGRGSTVVGETATIVGDATTAKSKAATKCSGGNMSSLQQHGVGEQTDTQSATVVAGNQTQQPLSQTTSGTTTTTTTTGTSSDRITNKEHSALLGEKKTQFSLTLKQRFCSLFRFRRNNDRNHHGHHHHHHHHHRHSSSHTGADANDADGGGGALINSHSKNTKRKNFQSRALPPLPKKNNTNTESSCKGKPEKKKLDTRPLQLTSSIEKVKDYGWYWGPLSSEAAEKVLSNEPDGSFIVRDSSDDHYIFSLSFKLNNCVRHVRIEQDQGTFSFGSYAKFKSQTITEFIEKAVEHSRSGRYLFFLHRRPEHGPMRVQLTNPVSRFKHVQSLQHMCRFVILKTVIRKDLIQTLPLPRRLLDYLNYKHCYSEQIECDSSHSQISGDGIS